MLLSKQNLQYINSPEIIKPDETTFTLPVKVLQFGTGVLLRGLPDYFIDKANRQGLFNGRVVIVKSTNSGNTEAFDQQDGLYTLVSKGIENGQNIEENIICAAISHVLSAVSNWDRVLEEVLNPELKIIISNTTEVGIQLVEEDINQSPPASFPAKLLALLYKRYQAFNGSKTTGFVIIPTELLPDNGKILKDIVLKLIKFNHLDPEFEKWVNESNYFCSSLVDRIVTGKPDIKDLRAFEEKARYKDELLTVSEVYCLWAIEGDEKIRSVLSFAGADEGVIIAPDINIYRELKLRLLNGTHTLSCALAFLSGFETVNAAMDNEVFVGFVRRLMAEISTAIPYPVEQKAAQDFSEKVLDRFKNPNIRHLWINISQQYTTKLKLRVLPVLHEYYKKFNKVPQEIAMGFAAYLVFMRPVKEINGQYFGEYGQLSYPINDDKASYFFNLSKNSPSLNIIAAILKDKSIWESDLTLLPGFAEKIQSYYDCILDGDIAENPN
ncbi:MAG: tagaturonate reductase [Sphingobacteriales bacterium]